MEFVTEALNCDSFEVLNDSLLQELLDKRDAEEIAQQEFIWYID